MKNVLTRISHTLPAAAADLLASTTFLPAAPAATCFEHDSTAPWSKRRADKHLRSLTTKVCEKCGLATVRDRLVTVGEAAGFQDSLWGFGLRYALTTGHMAARAFLAGSPQSYDRMWRRRFSSQMRTAAVNRFLFRIAGDRTLSWGPRPSRGQGRSAYLATSPLRTHGVESCTVPDDQKEGAEPSSSQGMRHGRVRLYLVPLSTPQPSGNGSVKP